MAIRGKELGIDEAGRGPVLGPMVMAGVLISEEEKGLLQSWGISDSKTFGSSAKGKEKRAELAQKIISTFPHEIIVLSHNLIDSYVREQSLNVLEQHTAQNIMQKLKADRVVLDGKNLFSPLVSENVLALNKADQSHLSVGAASIVAKHERDRIFTNLCQKFSDSYGEIRGGGYANKNTLDFVQWYQNHFGSLPSFYRKSYHWKALGTQ